MAVRFVGNKADPLIGDATPAKAVFTELNVEKLLTWWSKFPSPNARRKPCRFCGDVVTVACAVDDHSRCMTFATAERREKEKVDA